MRLLNHTGVPLTLYHTNDVTMDEGGVFFLRGDAPTEQVTVLPPEPRGEVKPPKMVIREVLDAGTEEISVFAVSYNQPDAKRPEFYRMEGTYWIVSRERARALREKGEYLRDILTPGRPVYKWDGTIIGYADLAPA